LESLNKAKAPASRTLLPFVYQSSSFIVCRCSCLFRVSFVSSPLLLVLSRIPTLPIPYWSVIKHPPPKSRANFRPTISRNRPSSAAIIRRTPRISSAKLSPPTSFCATTSFVKRLLNHTVGPAEKPFGPLLAACSTHRHSPLRQCSSPGTFTSDLEL